MKNEVSERIEGDEMKETDKNIQSESKKFLYCGFSGFSGNREQIPLKSRFQKVSKLNDKIHFKSLAIQQSWTHRTYKLASYILQIFQFGSRKSM
jgi:hypothetical protein